MLRNLRFQPLIGSSYIHRIATAFEFIYKYDQKIEQPTLAEGRKRGSRLENSP